MVKKRMSDVIALNRKRGQHWFEPATLEFFKSHYSPLYSDRYFISSEKAPYNPRRWSVRKVNWKTGIIGTVGHFQQFASEASAKKFLRDKKRLKDVM